MVYYECLCLTADEFEDLVGINPTDKELKKNKELAKDLVPIQILSENGVWKDHYLVSMHGVSESERAPLKKMQVSYEVVVRMAEELLGQEHHFAKNQSQNWFQFAQGDHAAKHRKQNRTNRPPHLVDCTMWRAKASEIKLARQAAELVASSGAPDSQDSHPDVFGDMDRENGEEEGPRHHRVATAAETFGSETPVVPKRKAAPKRRGRAALEEEDDEDADLASASGTGTHDSSARMVELSRSDPEMAVVAKRHESITNRPVSRCFLSLDIMFVIKNSGRIGQAINGAGAPATSYH